MSKRSDPPKQIQSATAGRVLVCSAALIFEPPLVSTKIAFGKQLAPYCYMPEQTVSPEDAERLCESPGSDVKWITAAELERRRSAMSTEKKRDLASFDLEQLEAMLNANINKDRANLQADLRECLANSLHPIAWDRWDDYSEEQRRGLCTEWIVQNHPELEPMRQEQWRGVARRDEIEREIRERELLAPTSNTDLDTKNARLAALRSERDKINARYKSARTAPSDASHSRGDLNTRLQERAEGIAEKMIADGKKATRRSVSAELEVRLKAEGTPMSKERIERLILKTWQQRIA